METDWIGIKNAFVSGSLTRKEICTKYGIGYQRLGRRITLEDWVGKRKQLSIKSENQLVTRTLKKADQWMDDQFNRCEKFRSKITESMEMTSGPIDPQALDQLTKAEMRVDDMGRRALGLVDPKTLDITSGGMPLGAFGAALDKIKGMVQSGEVNVEDLDVDKLSSSEIIRDGEE